MSSEQHEIIEHPPPLNPEAFTVAQDGTERVGDAVNVGNDPKPHKRIRTRSRGARSSDTGRSEGRNLW